MIFPKNVCFWSNFVIFVPKIECHEKDNCHRLCLVWACPAVRVVRFKPVHESHAESRKAVGETGETEQEAIQKSQGSPLQAPSPKDQEHDQEGQAPFRANAP